MGDVVNLNQARKARDKAERGKTAGENRAAHGRTKAEKSAEQARADKLKQTLDGARRDPDRPKT